MPLISFIIPAHNGENFLENCVDSIIAQNLLDFEIVIVENGSGDKTLEIAEDISKKDNRIRVFQSEKGVSRARNMGIEKAKGEYVCFVDQDDMLLATAQSVFLEAFEKYSGFEMLFATADSQENSENSEFTYFCDKHIEELLIKGLKAPTQNLTAWGKLYSLEFLKKNEIEFDETLSHAEDSDFVISALLASKNVVATRKAVYHYEINNNSAVHKLNLDLYKKYIDAMNKTALKVSNSSREIVEAFKFYVLDHLLIVLVHSVFKKENGKLKNQISLAKKILSQGIFSNSIENINLSETSKLKAVIFFFAKRKVIFPIYLACKIRQYQNSQKIKS